jgi:integrase
LDEQGKAVQTVAQARQLMENLKVKRAENDVPALTRTPRFADYVKIYMDAIRAGTGTKKPRTILKEDYTLAKWAEHMGGAHLDKIRRAHINSYITERLKKGASPRTVNLDVTILRNCLNRAIDDGWIKHLPTENLRPLETTTPKRPLFTSQDLEALCAAANDRKEDGSPVTKHGEQFCDYIRLLAWSGAREQEALGLRWRDVDFSRSQVTIGAEGDTKNRAGRVVDFNPKIKGHLLDMKARARGVSAWLFPSPQRGDKDVHAKTFRESLKLVRKHAAKKQPHLADKGFHDMRHLFCSMCVMSRVDFRTIAAWVGHKDGGILIGKVYGHLADEHRQAMAQKVNFEPTILPSTASA